MYVTMLHMEMNIIKYLFKKLQEEEAQDSKAIRSSEMIQDHLQKFKHEYFMLEGTIKKLTMKLEKLQKQLMGTNLADDEAVEKLIESVQKLEFALAQKKKKLEELEKEITEFKEYPKVANENENENGNGVCNTSEHLKQSELEKGVSINMLIREISNAKQKLETTSSKYISLKEHIQCLELDMLSIKDIPEKWEHLEKNYEDLEEKVLIFKNLTQEHMSQRKLANLSEQ
ncbi:ankyrin repeat domain-containing protein 26-like [Perognathus longimembris pacificus]|uniref:ankyrin repeat domain-containing protein 26-like n=1 Tax=Perognathus longimembris pacificus TaxID=214514 RepID=UPI002018B17C|nr:ankyrin repeat domain-containing protein 26-like [Perognathus longimembris pacificus]